ncbi:MAG: primosomal protein N' [Deltaproteobacteria bacterium]|nr:primosomal protein N' [Deltaproteobacteria bacterium]
MSKRREVSRASTVEVGVLAPPAGTFTYAVPPGLAARVRPGARILVPFGRRRLTGIALGEGRRDEGGAPRDVALREILDVLDDDLPALPESIIALLRWVADYYLHPLGLTLRAALPTALVASSRRTIVLTPAGREMVDTGVGETGLPAEALAHLARRRRVAERALAQRFGRAAVAALSERGWAALEDQVRQTSAPTRIEWRLNPEPGSPEEALEALPSRARSQRAALAHLAAHGPVSGGAIPEGAGFNDAALRALARKGLVLREEVAAEIDPFMGVPVARDTPPSLTAAQASAVEALHARLDEGGFEPFLLYGATGSGKTEVYLRVIDRALAAGQGALVLVPEIALTPQLVHRFRARFGDRVAVQHSGLTDRERADQWRRVRRSELPIVIGARSAVFAPLDGIGAIIVDEEHEGAYKQEENLLYNARDVAVMRGKMAGCIVVLGSATPSLESFRNAETGRYRRLDLPERVASRPLPEVTLVDMRKEPPAAGGELPALSTALRDALRATIERGEQAILFLNRRGFATFLFCRDCGHAFRCPNCDVSLVLHRRGASGRTDLRCHACDHHAEVPARCPECGGAHTEARGLGTQRVEEEVQAALPGARTARLDRDTASRRGSQERILARLRDGKADVLIGTQMVAKGHDFPGVTLVGIISAEASLYFPDFRAPERTFQLLTQVAGRAGRGDAPGRVLVQTFDPDNACLLHVRSHDYDGFFRDEIGHRKEPRWPPFCRLVSVRVTAPTAAGAESCAARCAAAARDALGRGEADLAGTEVLGPAPALIARVRNRWRWQLLLKGSRLAGLRRLALAALAAGAREGGGASVAVDVDPVGVL